MASVQARILISVICVFVLFLQLNYLCPLKNCWFHLHLFQICDENQKYIVHEYCGMSSDATFDLFHKFNQTRSFHFSRLLPLTGSGGC